LREVLHSATAKAVIPRVTAARLMPTEERAPDPEPLAASKTIWQLPEGQEIAIPPAELPLATKELF
jgi:hypothetical protein